MGSSPLQKIMMDFGKFGLDTRLPPISPQVLGFAKAQNIYFSPRASFVTRPGSLYLGPDFPNADKIDGLFDFWANASQEYILCVQGGILWVYNDGTSTWTQLTVSTPPSLALTFSSAGGTLVAGTMGYQITAVNAQGETLPCAEAYITTTATGEIILNWPAVPGALSYNIYGRFNPLGLLGNTVGTNFTDTGAAMKGVGVPILDTASLTPGIPWNFDILAEKCVMGNGVNHNLIYDGTTVTDLTITSGAYNLSPCRYFKTHGNRMYASGNPTLPSRVFWCAVYNPTNWTAPDDAGDVDVETGKDVVLGLGSFESDLWIFKGPNYGAIHVLTGTSYDNFQLVPVFRGMFGYHRSMVNVGNDLLFQGPDGIYSLAHMQWSGGNIQASRISENVQSLFNNLPETSIGAGCAVFYEPENIVMFYLSKGGVNLDYALVVSPPDPIDVNMFGFGAEQYKYRWSQWNVMPSDIVTYRIDSTGVKGALAGVIDSGTGNRRSALWDWTSGTDADGSSVLGVLSTSFLSMGHLMREKLLRHLAVAFFSTGELLVTLTMKNGGTWPVTFPVSTQSDWPVLPPSQNWPALPPSQNWPASAVPTLSNLPVGGGSTAFSISISNQSGVAEVFIYELLYLLGGWNEN